MLYTLVKQMVRQALRIFCSRIDIQGARYLATTGPMLLVANHPNSFLDAIIIGAICKEKVHFLTRGDAFHKPWHNILLKALNMIPVYRLSEGRENLSLNERAFRKSGEILQNGGIVLIFIEGICVHKHELQPFKKGAARIACDNQDLAGFRVVPVGIAYDSFERFGKKISIRVSPPFRVSELIIYTERERNYKHFNSLMYACLKENIRVPEKDAARKRQDRLPLFLPSVLGYILHAPLYYPLRNFIRRKTNGTVFFDSVMMGSLLILYPLYLALLSVLLYTLGASLPVILLIVILHPICAWCAVRVRI